jgi:mono/diheme cytochrome c family protein
VACASCEFHLFETVMQRTVAVRIAGLLVAGVIAGASVAPLAAAELTEQQRQLLKQSVAAQQEAGVAFQAGQFQQSGEKLAEAMRCLGLALRDADAETYQAAQRLIERIDRAHVVLQMEGLVLPPFDKPVFGTRWEIYATEDAVVARSATATVGPESKPAESRPEMTPTPPEPSENSGISFTGQVAPVLVQRCGKCHIAEKRGGFTMETFAALRQGPPEGTVLFPGDPLGSRLIETIETGDMPRGGGKVPPAELRMLKEWVTQGAKFDGADSDLPLVQMVAGGASMDRSNANGPTGKPAMAGSNTPAVTGGQQPQTVSFSRQVAPLLVENCNGCHIDAMQTRGGLNMTTMAQLLRGGDSGDIIVPGDGDGSLLVRKLRGQEGARMPAGGRPPLSDDAIGLIATWINEGAQLDAGTPEQPLRVMMTEAWAKNATHDELAQKRVELARDHWKLGVPVEARETAVENETSDVFVLGNVDAETAKTVGRAASDALEKIEKILPGKTTPTDQGGAKIRGRATLFLFSRRYDYSEFSKMVETRTIPSEWDVHWSFDGVDAYVSMVVTDQDTPKTLAARLVAPLGSLSVAMMGESPRWFREGVGKAVAAKTVARDFDGPRQWDAALPAAASVVKKPDELVQGKLPPEQADLIGYGIAKTLMDRQRRPQFAALLKNLQTGASFEDAFAGAYRIPLENFIAAWFGY